MAAAPDTATVALDAVTQKILLIRGRKVMLDADLADLYGVPTKALNEAVKRNSERFPDDFMLQLTKEEKNEVVTNCDHLAKLKFSRTPPYAFTEHGAIQAANVLASVQAVEMGIYVVRAFVKLREAAIEHRDLSRRLDVLEEKTEALAMDHESFSRNTRVQLRQLLDALRELTTHPDPPKRPIGFVPPEDKGETKTPKARRKP